MDPHAIRDSQFVVIQPLVYQHEGFTAAFGLWERQYHAVALRWDGEGDSPGYPVGRGGRPKWFVLPDVLARPFLCSLLAAPSTPGLSIAGLGQALAVLNAELAIPGSADVLRQQVLASDQFERRRAEAEQIQRSAIEAVDGEPKAWLVTVQDEGGHRHLAVPVRSRIRRRAERWALAWGHENVPARLVSSRIMTPEEERRAGAIPNADIAGELQEDLH